MEGHLILEILEQRNYFLNISILLSEIRTTYFIFVVGILISKS